MKYKLVIDKDAEEEMRKLPFSEIECITIIHRKVIAIDTNGNHYFYTH